MRNLLVSLALLAITATASAQSPRAASEAEATLPQPGSLILFLPASFEARELESGADVVLQAMHEWLARAGYKTALLNKQNYELLWRQEVEAAEHTHGAAAGHSRPDARAVALTTLASRLAHETSAQLILVPQLVLRSAQLSGTKAEWDGRQALIATRGLMYENSISRGSTLALSVHLLALTGTGAVAFRSYGGITLPYKINVLKERMELRNDLYESEQDVSEGARIALEPLLTRAPSATR
jgi:hypothetical protein